MQGPSSTAGYAVLVENLSVGVPAARRSLRGLFLSKQALDPEAPVDPECILKDVTARVDPGEVLAVIGGSGSGKSTLLHAIVSRLGKLPLIRGEVSIIPTATERHLSAGKAGSVVGFVPQNDYLLPNLTVLETLSYAATFRLGSSVNAETRQQIVQSTISELGLADSANTLVGGNGLKGISGGEKRRVSIGCVLVSNPSVLVLDEVTTGLDSFNAFQLLETLDKLAKCGRTVILSIHQPRSDAFPLFTKILLLSRGSVVYSGPKDSCLRYFARLGYTPPEQTNPLDFLIDISTVDYRDEKVECESRGRVNELVASWKAYQLIDPEATEPQDEDEKLASSVVPALESTHALSPVDNAGSVLRATALLHRAAQSAYRSHAELVGHLLQGIVLGLLTGLTFFRLGEQPNDIQSLKTLSFQLVPVYGYMTLVIWTHRWCNSLVVFDREQEDNLYSPVAWVMAEYLAWLPVNLVVPSIYAVMVYFISHLRTDDLASNLGLFVADMILVQTAFVSWSLLAGSLARDFATASFLGNALSIFFILSPGYFIINVPLWIRWFRWLSPHFYSFRVVALSQLRARTFACADVTGAARAQCTGANVLHGLRLAPAQPLLPWFLGLLGFSAVVTALALLALTLVRPGGVRHAPRVPARAPAGKDSAPGVEALRARVDVTARRVGLTYVARRSLVRERQETRVLSDVSACFRAGELAVVMGPSGSGKSTFLRMCAGRGCGVGLFGAFRASGEVLLNSVPVSKASRHLCAFMEQEDNYHLPALTVRETLRYAAMLKLPSTVSRKRKLARAEEVLQMLGLKDCADNMVGGELLKGISGGEKRRLSLACEMINNPSVLIADEPTSGLDANTARNVMEVLRDLARSGRTVVVSLHQPRSDIYNLIDNVLILAKRGRVVYHGRREGLLPHLALAGHICPPLYNPPDFCIDLISLSDRDPASRDESVRRIDALADAWKRREQKIDEAMAKSDPPITALPEAQVRDVDRPRHVALHIALPCLLDRMLRNTWRLGSPFRLRLLQPPFLALSFFLFFLRLTKGPPGAQDRIGLIAECTSIVPFVGFLNVIALYPADKALFTHEHASAGARYSPGAFLLAFTLFALPSEICAALAFTLLAHVATGMQTSARIFAQFAAAVWVQLSFGESVGVLVASFFDTVGLAVSLVSLVLTVAAQASGIFSASVVPWLAAAAWAFPVKYLPRILLVNEMTGLRFECSPESVQSGECLAATGEQVLETFGFHGSPSMLLAVSVALTVGYRLLAWLALELRMRYVT